MPFEELSESAKTSEMMRSAPLAERMRPTSLDNMFGQEHLITKGKLLRRLVESKNMPSVIFYGPPGTGKTTLSSIIAGELNAKIVKLNAVSSGVQDAKKVIEEAKKDATFGKKTFLFLDECHRWSKTQSDSILGAIEEGIITFIGSTTENPHYSMTKAIVSRCRVFEFKPLKESDIIKALKRAVTDKRRGLGGYNIKIDDTAYTAFAFLSGGDVRSALGALDLAFKTTEANENGEVHITNEIASECSGGKTISIDETDYYNKLSAFCKSLRGSDPDASLYWAFSLINAGVQAEVIARRLIAHASEDVGLANPTAMLVSVSALTAIKELGVPEGLIPLSEAIITVATSPKSNSVIEAMNKADEESKNAQGNEVPMHLRNYDYFSGEKYDSYKYPHAYGGYVEQDYLPARLKGTRFYYPTRNGHEAKIKETMERLDKKFQDNGGKINNGDTEFKHGNKKR